MSNDRQERESSLADCVSCGHDLASHYANGGCTMTACTCRRDSRGGKRKGGDSCVPTVTLQVQAGAYFWECSCGQHAHPFLFETPARALEDYRLNHPERQTWYVID